MDAFVKVRRRRNQDRSNQKDVQDRDHPCPASQWRSSSSDDDGNKDLKMPASCCKHAPKTGTSSSLSPSEDNNSKEAAASSAWPLHFRPPSCASTSLPTSYQSSEDLSSCASSGYLPSFSSGHQDSSDDVNSSCCSSPLTYSGEDDDSGSDDDNLSDTIARAKFCSNSYRESLNVGMAIRRRDRPEEEPLMPTEPQGDTRQELQRLVSRRRGDLGSACSGTTGYKKASRSSPLFMLGSDLFAEVMCFLDPSETLKVLTTPLCQEFRRSYSTQQDLWKVLCGFKPFKAAVWAGGASSDDGNSSSSEESFCSLSPREPLVNNIFGKYRLRYTSFVRCMQYLDRIKEDARNGRPPSVIDLGQRGFPNFGVSKGLKKFLSQSKAKGASLGGTTNGAADTAAAALPGPEGMSPSPIGVSDDGNAPAAGSKKRPAAMPAPVAKKPKFGNSMITSRLLGPAADGKVSHLSLPQSCAIYSIVNWMVAFPDVEGIQTMCIDCLPCLLEDEQQRLTAQRVGLVEVVLRAMLRFRGCLNLHIAALHTMVLLARPLGGKEGMLFDHSMAESSANLGLAGGGPSVLTRSRLPGGVASLDRRHSSRLSGASGIGIMIDSMRRFESEAKLQAMGCWAMVNLALVPAQKTMLLNLNAIQAVIKAMQTHTKSFDVQFRALFALINLVVPCGEPRDQIPPGQIDAFKAEKEMLDSNMNEIARLVVRAMKNFCSSETILNRACLVLHNISQNSEYLGTLLWTSHCYQMIEWCIVNHPTDQVLRRSAVSVLHRLQVLLSTSEVLRSRFRDFVRSEQQFSIANPAARN